MDAMTHATALATHAVDRYALGDMSEDEATVFESHYFDCADCARDVRETMSFVDNARVALRKAPATTAGSGAGRRGAFRAAVALPWAAVLVLGLFSGYQALRAPSSAVLEDAAVTDWTILRAVRAEAPVVRPSGPAFVVSLDVTAPEPHARYGVEFRNAADAIVAAVDAVPAPASGTLLLTLRSERFPDGAYRAILVGIEDDGTRQPVETYRFDVGRDDSPREGDDHGNE